MEDIVIAEAVRSAVGRGYKGTLATKRPDELAVDVIRGLMKRVPQLRGKIDDVVLGCAMPEGEQGLNVARGRSRSPQISASRSRRRPSTDSARAASRRSRSRPARSRSAPTTS